MDEALLANDMEISDSLDRGDIIDRIDELKASHAYRKQEIQELAKDKIRKWTESDVSLWARMNELPRKFQKVVVKLTLSGDILIDEKFQKIFFKNDIGIKGSQYRRKIMNQIARLKRHPDQEVKKFDFYKTQSELRKRTPSKRAFLDLQQSRQTKGAQSLGAKPETGVPMPF